MPIVNITALKRAQLPVKNKTKQYSTNSDSEYYAAYISILKMIYITPKIVISRCGG